MKITSFSIQWGASELEFFLRHVPQLGHEVYIAVDGLSWQSEDPPHQWITEVAAVYVCSSAMMMTEGSECAIREIVDPSERKFFLEALGIIEAERPMTQSEKDQLEPLIFGKKEAK